MKIYFDVWHLYYLSQYLPVACELISRGHKCIFLVQRSASMQEVLDKTVVKENLTVIWVDGRHQAKQMVLNDQPEWLIIGNADKDIAQYPSHTQTALMQHGIGPKSCYYSVSESLTNVRFVEGPHRLQRLQSLYPEGNFVDTGYAKLDPIVNRTAEEFNLANAGLDPAKPTILYTPTFYPSSIELLAKNWPEQLSDYNILVKPHFFSLVKKKYAKQRKQFAAWQGYKNVYVASTLEHNLLPFMQTADLLISDASSALFEFIALDKPAIWCDFYKLRWFYRGIFSYRFKQRMDSDLQIFAKVATQVSQPQALNAAIRAQVNNPGQQQAARQAYTQSMVGSVDGKCSQRIANYLETNVKQKQ